MADVSELLTGISSLYWTPGAAVLSEVSQHRPDFQMAHSGLVRLHRRCISGASGLARGVEGDPDSTCRVVRRALGDAGRYLGTTISPYLFFWQAAQEVEQEAALGLPAHIDPGEVNAKLFITVLFGFGLGLVSAMRRSS